MDIKFHIEPLKIEVQLVGLAASQYNEIISKLNQILAKENTMSQQLDDLQTKVAANGTVILSAITLIRGIKQQLDAAGTDPVALKALSDQLDSQDTALAAAIVENTPSAAPPSVA